MTKQPTPPAATPDETSKPTPPAEKPASSKWPKYVAVSPITIINPAGGSTMIQAGEEVNPDMFASEDRFEALVIPPGGNRGSIIAGKYYSKFLAQKKKDAERARAGKK